MCLFNAVYKIPICYSAFFRSLSGLRLFLYEIVYCWLPFTLFAFLSTPFFHSSYSSNSSSLSFLPPYLDLPPILVPRGASRAYTAPGSARIRRKLQKEEVLMGRINGFGDVGGIKSDCVMCFVDNAFALHDLIQSWKHISAS